MQWKQNASAAEQNKTSQNISNKRMQNKNAMEHHGLANSFKGNAVNRAEVSESDVPKLLVPSGSTARKFWREPRSGICPVGLVGQSPRLHPAITSLSHTAMRSLGIGPPSQTPPDWRQCCTVVPAYSEAGE